ncbi:MAG TPA: glycosyltransferase [bacterium]|nr:glycosyltransferase [bacterium]
MISVCVPSYNGAATVADLCRSVADVMSGMDEDWELLVVLDGSTDASESVLNPLVLDGTIDKVIVLARRCGQQRATLRGIAAARGDVVVTIDDDFGHQPRAIAEMVPLLDRNSPGGDVLFALPSTTGRVAARNWGAALRSALFRLVAGAPADLVPSSFRFFTRPCSEALLASINQCTYLSVDLVRHAARVRSVPLGDSISISSGPSRRRGLSLLISFLSLGLYLPFVPCVLRRAFGGMGRIDVRELRGPAGCLLVVGAGRGQCGLIRRGIEHGLRVLVSDRDPGAPGAGIAERLLVADTFDPKGTVSAVRDLQSEGLRIDGVATAGTDQPVLTVAAVAEAFGLGGALPYDVALAVTNKSVMKKRLNELGLPTLAWRLVGPEDASSGAKVVRDVAPEGAAVLKPMDSQGQRGIFLVRNDAEVFGYLPQTLSYSREPRAMLECFYPSEEVTLSGWVHRGRLYPLLLTDRATMTSGPHIGICPAHRYPSRHFRNHGAEIVSICSRFVEGFGIQSGPIYVQLLIGSEGVVINEVACRIGGAYEEVLVPALTGVDILDLQLELAMHGSIDPEAVVALERASRQWPPRGFATTVLAFTGEGRVGRVGDQAVLAALPGVRGAGYLLDAGTHIGSLVNSTGRAAWGVITATSRAHINRRIHRFYDALDVESDSGVNLVRDLRSAALHLEDS